MPPTLDLKEAIQHALEKAQGDDDCAKEHKQLATWLKELEFFRGLFGGTCRETVEEALEADEALVADGFEDALVGYVRRFNSGPLALYNYEKCVEILMRDGDTDYEEAVEYLEFNTLGAWVGEKTPAFATFISIMSEPRGPWTVDPDRGPVRLDEQGKAPEPNPRLAFFREVIGKWGELDEETKERLNLGLREAYRAK